RKSADGLCEEGEIRLWDFYALEPLGPPLRGHHGWVESLAFSPDGRSLVSGGDDGTLIVWDVVSGRADGPIPGHVGQVSSVAFSPSGDMFASSGYDKTVILWDAQTRRPLRYMTEASAATSVAFSRDGTRLAIGSWDRTISLHDVATGTARAQ